MCVCACAQQLLRGLVFGAVSLLFLWWRWGEQWGRYMGERGMELANALLERNLVPDWLLRRGIRYMLGERLREEEALARDPAYTWDFVQGLKGMEIAIQTDKANDQHYEVPTQFYTMVLGPALKYSSCLYTEPTVALEEAEQDMLLQTVERGRLENGMEVLDLGCGWGSLTLYIAENYPKCKITSLSNSWTQKQYIDSICKERGYKNVTVETGDVKEVNTAPKPNNAKRASPAHSLHDLAWNSRRSFDRVISVEMFEHMKNYEHLMKKVSSWLKPKGLFFVHHFCHRTYAYHFESEGASNWMGKYFFSGGTMPSDNMLLHFQRDLLHVETWKVNGIHYSRTLEAWLDRMDEQILPVRSVLVSTYGKKDAVKFEAYWRAFFMACSELFKYGDGWEWYVVHHLFEKK